MIHITLEKSGGLSQNATYFTVSVTRLLRTRRNIFEAPGSRPQYARIRGCAEAYRGIWRALSLVFSTVLVVTRLLLWRALGLVFATISVIFEVTHDRSAPKIKRADGRNRKRPDGALCPQIHRLYNAALGKKRDRHSDDLLPPLGKQLRTIRPIMDLCHG